MGFDWPASPLAFVLLTTLTGVAFFLHARALLKGTLVRLAWRLIALRFVAVAFCLFLLARPFLNKETPDTSKLKLATLVDLSGSMDARDERTSPSRIAQVRPFFDFRREDGWAARMNRKYEKIDFFGFSEEKDRLTLQSWSETSLGKKTALGDALDATLRQGQGEERVASVVVFSDGASNAGRPLMEVAKEFRNRGIPINVVGVGKEVGRGDLSVSFVERQPKAVAKDELLLSARVENYFDRKVSTEITLLDGEEILQKIPVELARNESRVISMPPITPKFAGPKRFRLVVSSPEGDAEPANDSDSILVMVRPPDQFSLLYLSNRIRPLYPFIKRSLANEERFEFNSLIRLGEKVFHAFGEKVRPNYPADPDFWMDFDAVFLDLEALHDLNASMVGSIKDYVQKRGGGLLVFGSIEEAREKLGGLLPVREAEAVFARDDLSLRVYEEPLFTPKDEVEKMKPFMPDRLTGYFVKEQNKGARGVVVSKANGKPVLSIQAYGAGKVAYWGVPGDWRRAIGDEEGAKEFRKFWQALTQWLGEGGEERLKIVDEARQIDRGEKTELKVEALGSNFEPAMDAMVRAEIEGPDGSMQAMDLYPQGAVAGQYASSFQPRQPGAYGVKYFLKFPDGEELSAETYLKVSETGEEARDLAYAERELRMLAKLTGGNFLEIAEMKDDWEPAFSQDVPILRQRADLLEFWPLFILMFLAAGMEWVMRRQAGLR